MRREIGKYERESMKRRHHALSEKRIYGGGLSPWEARELDELERRFGPIDRQSTNLSDLSP